MGKVDEVDAQLQAEDVDDVFLGDEPDVDEGLAQALARCLLHLERVFELGLRDVAGLDEHVSQSLVCHGLPLAWYALQLRMC